MRNDLEEIKKIVLGEKRQRNTSRVLAIGMGITIVAAVAGAIWYFFLKDKNNDDWDNDDWDDDDFDDDDDDDCDSEECDFEEDIEDIDIVDVEKENK